MNKKGLLEEVEKRLSKMASMRQEYEEVWKDVGELIAPGRLSHLYPDRSQRNYSRQYDTEPLNALRLFADGIFGYVMSPATRWFRLALPQEGYRELPGVEKWLEQCAERLYTVFASQQFYLEAYSGILDAGLFGQTVMMIEDDLRRQATKFSTRPLGEYYIEENADGVVDTLGRTLRLSHREIAQLWGEDAYEGLADKVREKPYDVQEVNQLILPSSEVDAGVNFTYASIYWIPGEEKPLEVGGYNERPFAAWRLDRYTGESYGESPATEGLAHVKRIHMVQRDRIKGVNRAVDPPLIADDRLKGRLDTRPGAITYRTNANHRVEAIFQAAGDYSIGRELYEELKAQLRQLYKVDFFLALTAGEQRARTAYEVSQMQGEKAAILGPMIGRMGIEYLAAIINRTFSIEHLAGRMPPPPPYVASVLAERDVEYDVEFEGPLFQAQKQHLAGQGLREGLASLAEVARFNPNVIDLIDTDEAGRLSLKGAGAPTSIIKDQGRVNRERGARLAAQAQAEQARAQAENLKNLGSAYKAGATAPDEGSLSEAIAQQLGAALQRGQQ